MYKYNYADIGTRIRSERIKRKWNQNEMIEKLEQLGIKIGRNTLSAIENGDVESVRGDFKLIPALCELFDCDAGYLLCEYDARLSTTEDVILYTGLSEAAVNTVCADKIHKAISDYILASEYSNSIIHEIHQYLLDSYITHLSNQPDTVRRFRLSASEVIESEDELLLERYKIDTLVGKLLDSIFDPVDNKIGVAFDKLADKLISLRLDKISGDDEDLFNMLIDKK